MHLKFLDQGGDCRGKILFFNYNQIKINLFEIKKGYARGGHYHDYDIIHTLVIGKIEHRTKSLNSKKEIIEIISAPAIIKIPSKSANLIIALEHSLFSEIFDTEYKSTIFSEYREIVLHKMNNVNFESSNTLNIEKFVNDPRGILFCGKFGKNNFNLIEIKKGYARGGHYHKFKSEHIVLSGKIKYLEKNLESSKESEKIMMGPNIILTRPKIAHLFLGLENSIFIESFTGNYEAIYYPGYRKIVENRIKKLSLV